MSPIQRRRTDPTNGATSLGTICYYAKAFGADAKISDRSTNVRRTISRYVVLERVGAGSMGVVYSAYDPKLDRKVALKLLRPQISNPGQLEVGTARLEREAKALAKLSHPNVIAVYDVESVDSALQGPNTIELAIRKETLPARNY